MKTSAIVLFAVLVIVHESVAFPAWSWGGGGGGKKTTTTTQAAIPPGGEDTGDFTTAAPLQYRQCIAACPILPQYNPVCGTNGQTYDNESRLTCARNCGMRDLQVARIGTCAPL